MAVPALIDRWIETGEIPADVEWSRPPGAALGELDRRLQGAGWTVDWAPNGFFARFRKGVETETVTLLPPVEAQGPLRSRKTLGDLDVRWQPFASAWGGEVPEAVGRDLEVVVPAGALVAADRVARVLERSGFETDASAPGRVVADRGDGGAVRVEVALVEEDPAHTRTLWSWDGPTGGAERLLPPEWWRASEGGTEGEVELEDCRDGWWEATPARLRRFGWKVADSDDDDDPRVRRLRQPGRILELRPAGECAVEWQIAEDRLPRLTTPDGWNAVPSLAGGVSGLSVSAPGRRDDGFAAWLPAFEAVGCVAEPRSGSVATVVCPDIRTFELSFRDSGRDRVTGTITPRLGGSSVRIPRTVDDLGTYVDAVVRAYEKDGWTLQELLASARVDTPEAPSTLVARFGPKSGVLLAGPVVLDRFRAAPRRPPARPGTPVPAPVPAAAEPDVWSLDPKIFLSGRTDGDIALVGGTDALEAYAARLPSGGFRLVSTAWDASYRGRQSFGLRASGATVTVTFDAPRTTTCDGIADPCCASGRPLPQVAASAPGCTPILSVPGAAVLRCGEGLVRLAEDPVDGCGMSTSSLGDLAPLAALLETADARDGRIVRWYRPYGRGIDDAVALLAGDGLAVSESGEIWRGDARWPARWTSDAGALMVTFDRRISVPRWAGFALPAGARLVSVDNGAVVAVGTTIAAMESALAASGWTRTDAGWRQGDGLATVAAEGDMVAIFAGDLPADRFGVRWPAGGFVDPSGHVIRWTFEEPVPLRFLAELDAAIVAAGNTRSRRGTFVLEFDHPSGTMSWRTSSDRIHWTFRPTKPILSSGP